MRQRGGKHEETTKYAKDKCHVVTLIAKLVGHYCNLD